MRKLSGDARFIALIVIAVAVLFSDVLFFGNGFYLRDVLRDHMPSRFVLRQIVLRHHELPLWNPWFSAGQPLAANPGYQAFYPGTWLTLLPDFRWGFDLEIVAHVMLAAAGMFALLRGLALRIESALFGAIAFALGGAILSFTSALPYLAAVAWWPLILLYTIRVLRGGRRRDAALLALTLGMMFLAAEQSVMIQTAILIASVVIAERRPIKFLAAACVAGLLIASVQIAPALALKRESGRGKDLRADEALAWSMPRDRVIELVAPHAHGRISDDANSYTGAARYRPPRVPLVLGIYCGIAVPLLFVAGLFMPSDARAAASRRTPKAWAISLVVLSYLMAIGDNGPLMRWLYNAGVFRTIRYPEKFIVFGLFAMIVFAAMVIDRLDRRLAIVLVIITTADVLRQFNELSPRKPAEFFEPPPLANVLAETRGRSRVFWPVEWHPRLGAILGRDATAAAHEMLIPFANALYGIASVGEIDINLTTQQRSADFVQSMWETAARTKQFGPFLAMANVEYVVTPQVVHTPTRPRYDFADQIVPIRSRGDFVNAMTRGGWSDRVAFVETTPFAPAPGDVLRVVERPNDVDLDIRADGRALLLIRSTFHKNWRAAIDGRDTALQPANIGFTALEVPAGTHHVALRFRDPVVTIGAIVSLIALAGTLFMLRERSS